MGSFPNIYSQQKFYFEADSCLFELKITNKGKTKQGVFKFSAELLTLNYSNDDRYFLASKSKKSVNLVFSEVKYKGRIISFFIGTCNEDAFPVWCEIDSLSLIKLPSKVKVREEFLFSAQKDIAEYLESSHVVFVIRSEKSDCFNIKPSNKQFFNCSNLFKVSVNAHKQNKILPNNRTSDE
jgi:hypothetical protein